MVNEYLECKLWGKLFNIEVFYYCYMEEHIQQSQKNTYDDFIKNNTCLEDGVRVFVSPELEISKKEILKYLKEEYKADLEIVENNIFHFITPFRLGVPENNEAKQIFIKFNTVFDDEHGLAIEFINNKFVRVGDYDISLV